jgi:hypothetical protein
VNSVIDVHGPELQLRPMCGQPGQQRRRINAAAESNN